MNLTLSARSSSNALCNRPVNAPRPANINIKKTNTNNKFPMNTAKEPKVVDMMEVTEDVSMFLVQSICSRYFWTSAMGIFN